MGSASKRLRRRRCCEGHHATASNPTIDAVTWGQVQEKERAMERGLLAGLGSEHPNRRAQRQRHRRAGRGGGAHAHGCGGWRDNKTNQHPNKQPHHSHTNMPVAPMRFRNQLNFN